MNNIKYFDEIYERAVIALSAYEGQHYEYFSRVYNLLDEALYLLIYELFSTKDRIDRNALNSSLQDYEKETVTLTVKLILNSHHYKETCTKSYSKELYRHLVGELSLGNKLYYFIIAANKQKHYFLKRFLKENYGFIEMIEKYATDRGHSKQNSFSKGEYSALNDRMLNFCENVSRYIKEIETGGIIKNG